MQTRMKMDHQEAARIQACGRYLLGQLTAPEKEAFEEHFFLCAECAEEVKIGAIFVDNAREVSRDQARRPTALSPAAYPQAVSGWRAWLPAAGLSLGWAKLAPSLTAAVLVCVAGYDHLKIIPGQRGEIAEQRGEIAELTKPKPLYEVLARGAFKGSGSAKPIPRDQRIFTLRFDFPGAEDQYICDLKTESGKLVKTVTFKNLRSNQSQILQLNHADFPDGNYQMEIRPVSSEAKSKLYYFQVTSH